VRLGLPEGGDEMDSSGESAQQAGSAKKRLDSKFKRNLLIIGGFLLICVIAMASFVFISGKNKNDAMPKSVVDKGMGGERKASGNLSPDEMARLNRVTEKKAEEAQAQGKTFIPKDIPISTNSGSGYIPSADVEAAKNAPPPGAAYNVTTGANASNGVSAQEAERYQRMIQGMQVQLQKLVQANAAPVSSSAPQYKKVSDESSQAVMMSAAKISKHNKRRINTTRRSLLML